MFKRPQMKVSVSMCAIQSHGRDNQFQNIVKEVNFGHPLTFKMAKNFQIYVNTDYWRKEAGRGSWRIEIVMWFRKIHCYYISAAFRALSSCVLQVSLITPRLFLISTFATVRGWNLKRFSFLYDHIIAFQVPLNARCWFNFELRSFACNMKSP